MNEKDTTAKMGDVPLQTGKQDPATDSSGNPPNAATVAGERTKRKYTRRKPSMAPDAEPTESRPKVDPAIVEESVKTVIAALDGVLVKRIYDSARYITEDKDYAQTLAIQAGMQKQELETVGKLSGAVAEQYGILGQHAPLAMLAGVLGGYAVRIWLVLREVETLRRVAIEQGILSKDGKKPKP